jgi:alpha-1,2-mannosyltransferase
MTMAQRDQTPWIDRAAPLLAGLVWIIPLIVISIGVLRRPGRSLDPVYRGAIDAFVRGETMYSDFNGFNYLPTFIPLYWPFEALPIPIGEIVWRWLAAICLAHALWQLMRIQARPASARGFLLLSLASLPVSLGALQMGQANIWIAASLCQAAVALGRERWWCAAMWLALGFAVKPIMLAPIGLAVLRSRQLWLPLTVLLVAASALPFAFAPSAYVWSQYLDFWRNLTESCAQVTTHRFADINGLLRTLGTELSGPWSIVARAAFGLALAALLLIRGRRSSPQEWSFTWLSLGASYVLLCNPMSEANSYCIFGVPAALLAWQLLGEGESLTAPKPALTLAFGWLVIAILILMGIGSELTRPWLGNSLDLWLFPCCALGLAATVSARLMAGCEHYRTGEAS